MRKTLFYGAVFSSWVILTSYIVTKVCYEPGPWGLGSTVSNSVDLIALIAAGVLVGILLFDPKRIIYAYAGATLLSFMLALIASTIIDWFMLGNNISFSQNSYGLQWTAYFALLRIFRAIFPAGVIVSFLSAFAGGIIGNLLGVDRFITEKLEKPLP